MAEVNTATAAGAAAEINATTADATVKTAPEPEKGEKTYTAEEVDKIIGAKFARWQAEQEKKIAEAEKLAQMNEAEKTKYEKEQLEKELAQLKAEQNHSAMIKQARGMLKEQGVTLPDEVLDVLVTSDDAAKTKATVEAFSQAYKDAVAKGVADSLHTGTPKTGTAPKMTMDEIQKIKDPIERQKLIEANIIRRN